MNIQRAFLQQVKPFDWCQTQEIVIPLIEALQTLTIKKTVPHPATLFKISEVHAIKAAAGFWFSV